MIPVNSVFRRDIVIVTSVCGELGVSIEIGIDVLPLPILGMSLTLNDTFDSGYTSIRVFRGISYKAPGAPLIVVSYTAQST